MDSFDVLEQLASAIQAAGKIKKVMYSTLHSDERVSIRQSNAAILSQVLEIISGYSSGTRQRALQETAGRIKTYDTAFWQLKRHMDDSRNKKASVGNVNKALSILLPLFPQKYRVSLDKVVKVLDIISTP